MNRNGREVKWVELQPWLCLRNSPIFSQVVISQAGCRLWQGTLGRAAPVLCYHWSLTVRFHLSELLLYKQKKAPKLPHTYNTSNSHTFPFSLLMLNNFIFLKKGNASKKKYIDCFKVWREMSSLCSKLNGNWDLAYQMFKSEETVRKNMPVCEFVYKCVSAAWWNQNRQCLVSQHPNQHQDWESAQCLWKTGRVKGTGINTRRV